MDDSGGEDVEQLTAAVKALAGALAVLATELRQVRGKVLPLSLGKRISLAAEETERIARDVATRL
jgi:hypothetical protein